MRYPSTSFRCILTFVAPNITRTLDSVAAFRLTCLTNRTTKHEQGNTMNWYAITDGTTRIYTRSTEATALAMAARWTAKYDGAYEVELVRCHVLRMTLEDGGLDQITMH